MPLTAWTRIAMETKEKTNKVRIDEKPYRQNWKWNGRQSGKRSLEQGNTNQLRIAKFLQETAIKTESYRKMARIVEGFKEQMRIQTSISTKSSFALSTRIVSTQHDESKSCSLWMMIMTWRPNTYLWICHLLFIFLCFLLQDSPVIIMALFNLYHRVQRWFLAVVILDGALDICSIKQLISTLRNGIQKMCFYSIIV